MTKTNFEKVTEFNTAFEAVVNTVPKLDIFRSDPELVKNRLALITEEYNELREAIENRDLVETVDALCDLLYVTEGFFNALGVDATKAFDVVHSSNMTKLCTLEEEAKLSVDKYREEGRYKEPSYRLSRCGRYWIVFDAATKKILKNINYVSADFRDVLFGEREP